MQPPQLRDAPKDHSRRANWWFVDDQGRRIGHLWPEDTKAVLESIWGEGQGIKAFAVYTGLHRKTIEAYCNGKSPVPKEIALLIMSLQQIMLSANAHVKAHPWRCLPRIEADWLPKDRQDERFEVPDKPFG